MNRVREEVCTELAKAQAYRDDPGVSRILGSLLTDDPARKVRLAAIQGMELRGDRRVLRILKKVSKKEKDERVRTEARRVYRRLSKIPKKPKKPKRKPKKGEIKGVDECSNGYGWCECRRGPLKPSPRCVSRDGCIELYDTNYHRLGYRCTWDGQNLE